MATLFYGVSGEGRGHASRSAALIDELRRDHELHVFTYGDALEILRQRYRDSGDVRLVPIPGVRFRYNRRGRLRHFGSLFGAIPYVVRMSQAVRRLLGEAERHAPELMITDFEPLVPRAARKAGIPFLAIDHQHMLSLCDLGQLPAPLRRRAALMAPWIGAFCSGQQQTVVSGFALPPVLPAYEDKVVTTGVFLSEHVRRMTPRTGEHVLVYMRRALPRSFVDLLSGLPHPVRIYGMGRHPSIGRVSFHPVHAEHFVEDLASCRALVTTAGNQLIGEALFFGKPVLALPEPANFEQQINGELLRNSGAGSMSSLGTLDLKTLRRFIERAPAPPAAIRERQRQGCEVARAAVEKLLGRSDNGNIAEGVA